MQIARELIQQDDQRQRAARRFGPVVKHACLGIAQRVGEARARGVEVLVLLEPHLPVRGRIAGEPIIQHVVLRHHASARSSNRTEWIASRPAKSRIW